MKIDAYLITCLTNMHVGAGGTNYDIIDNMVQRDVTTGLPTIHSSSLKGALREFFKNQWGEGDVKLNHVFGSDNGRKDTSEKSSVGNFSFFPAHLVSIPVRSKEKLFYSATSAATLDNIDALAEKFGKNALFNTPVKADKENPLTKDANQTLEAWKSKGGLNFTNIQVGSNIALFHDEDFKRLADKLPSIARNKLDNGESKNLWYEEVVPRGTRFIFFVAKSGQYYTEFEQALQNNVVQIGANASIGYGFCKIEKIGTNA